MRLRRKKPLKNPWDEDVALLAELASGSGEHTVEDLRLGSGLSRSAREVLQVAEHAFSGGYAFSRDELTKEVQGQLVGSTGRTLSDSTASIEASKALRDMLARKIVSSVGRRLDRSGNLGPERYVFTQHGAEVALGDRLNAADDYAERAIESAIESFEEAPPRERKPRTRTYVEPHAAAGKRHCGLCALRHRLREHRSHRVDGARRECSLVGVCKDEEGPPVANPTTKLSKAARKFLKRKIRALIREGKTIKKAVAIAFSDARKRGLKVPKPLLKNPVSMLGTLGFNPHKKAKKPKAKRPHPTKRAPRNARPVPLAEVATGSLVRFEQGGSRDYIARGGGYVSARSGGQLWHVGRDMKVTRVRDPRWTEKDAAYYRKNPIAKKKRKAKRRPSSGSLVRFLARKPKGFSCLWRDLPESVRRRDRLARRSALKWARINGVSLDHVPVRKSKVPGYWVAAGRALAVEYLVEHGRRKGKAYRHAAGDHGRGRRKSEPAVIAQNTETGLIATVPVEGSKLNLGDRGLTG